MQTHTFVMLLPILPNSAKHLTHIPLHAHRRLAGKQAALPPAAAIPATPLVAAPALPPTTPRPPHP